MAILATPKSMNKVKKPYAMVKSNDEFCMIRVLFKFYGKSYHQFMYTMKAMKLNELTERTNIRPTFKHISILLLLL